MCVVSVVLPSYNSAGYLPAAIESVLAQSFRDFEVLVIDDGSTDESESVVRRYGAAVRYIKQENGGVSSARNRGIAESQGTYVAFLDADDVWLERKLERQLATLSAQLGRCRASYTDVRAVSQNLSPLRPRRASRHSPTLDSLLTLGNVIGTPSSVVVETDLIRSLGGFDTSLSQSADWDMWIRVSRETEFCHVNEALVLYRVHGASMSRNARLLEHDNLIALRKGFAAGGLSGALRARRRAAFSRAYMVIAGNYFHGRRLLDSARCAAIALALDPRKAGYLASFPARSLRRFYEGVVARANRGRDNEFEKLEVITGQGRRPAAGAR